MWSEPVMFGGGMTMQKRRSLEPGCAVNQPAFNQTSYQRASVWRGS